MAKDIPRKTLKEIVRDYNAGLLSRSEFPKTSSASSYWNFKSTSDVTTGATLYIAGFNPSATPWSYERARTAFLSNELILRGYPTTASSSAVALRTGSAPFAFKSSVLGKIWAPDLEARVLTLRTSTGTGDDPTTDQYATAAGTTSADASDFLIIDKSAASSGKVFAVVRKVASGGGGGGGTLVLTKGTFLKTATPSTRSFLTSASVEKTTTPKTVITEVAVTNGALVFTSESLSLITDVTASTDSASAVTSVATTNGTAVTDARLE